MLAEIVAVHFLNAFRIVLPCGGQAFDLAKGALISSAQVDRASCWISSVDDSIKGTFNSGQLCVRYQQALHDYICHSALANTEAYLLLSRTTAMALTCFLDIGPIENVSDHPTIGKYNMHTFLC